MTKYFDLHVFHERTVGFSVGVKVETEKDFLTESEVIDVALYEGLIDPEDERYIDYVLEIEEDEYKLLTY